MVLETERANSYSSIRKPYVAEKDQQLGITGSESKATGIVVVIPAFNEERFIGSVVLAASRFAETVLVVDDGSTDDTACIASAGGARVIRLPQNTGKAAAIRHGFRTLLDDGAIRAVVLMDGDGQHFPNELPRLIEPILRGTADVVVGSRFLQDHSEIPWWRQIGQHGLTWLTNTTSGIHLTDSQSGFRALSRQAIQSVTIRSQGFAVESEMQFAIKEQGLRVIEIPIHCAYAEPPKRNPVIHGLQVIDGILKLIGQMRPMLFFGIPSLILFVGGFLLGVYVVKIYERTQVLAIGYALISVLLAIIGVIGLSTGVILHSVRALLLDLLKR